MKKKREKRDISLLARLILLMRAAKKRLYELRPMRRLSERQKTLSHVSDGFAFEESKISYLFGMARVISVFLLVTVLMLSLIFGSGAISYEKMYYMFKDIAYIKSYGEGIPYELSYSSPVRNQVYADFKNGLLVASDSELKMFTSTGRVTFSEGSDFANPHVVCSSSSALIYDQGRRTYSVYNSFAKLYSEKTEYPIATADMAENGSYLVVTRSKLYDSVVRIYGQDFALAAEYRKNDTVVSASMSDNGRYAVTVSLSVHGGKSSAQLDILDCKKGKVTAQSIIDGITPYMCKFLSDDRIAVFASDSFFVINRKAETLLEYRYPSEVENIDVNENGFAMLFSKADAAGDKMLEIFDNNGKKTFVRSFDGNVRDVKLGDGHVYVMKSNEISRISTSLGTERSISSTPDGMKLMLFGDGRVAVCSWNAAKYISFD